MRKPILTISDIQFHAYKQYSRLVGGRNSRLLDIQGAWEYAIDAAVSNDCGVILIPGDVFEIRGALKPSVFNQVTALMQDAIDRGFEIVAIPGNHDMEHYEGGDTAIDTWSFLSPNITMENRCTVLKSADIIERGGYRIAGIPYIHDIEKFKKTFLDISESDPDVTMIHQGVDDFDATGILKTGITAQWLADNNQGIILCGHYHDAKRLGRVVNVGALVQHRHSDEGQERGAWVIPNVQDPDKIEFYPIQGPRFITVDSKAAINGNCKDSFVRVKAKNMKEAEKLKKLAADAGALGVSVQIEREFVTAHDKTVQLSTPRNMLGEYLDIVPKFGPKKAEILNLFDKVCLGRQA